MEDQDYLKPSTVDEATAIIRDQYGIDISDPDVRAYLRKDLYWWIRIYLSHYFDTGDADFHQELARLLQDPTEESLGIVGFRGSAKSTYGSLGLVVWSALEGGRKFILPIADTGQQMLLNMENIKYELENNELILLDYGNVWNKTKWAMSNMLLNNGTRIMGRSRGQKIRGMRHRQYRPDLIVIDDPEDLSWVGKKENRDKTESWFNNEVVPAQKESGAKMVVIGNLLHTDALMMRLKKRKLFKFLEFPLITDDGEVTWAWKYPTIKSIKDQISKVGLVTWLREYLLKIVPEEDVPVQANQIVYYDAKKVLPTLRPKNAGAGMDFAIGESKSSDYTSIVSGIGVMEGGQEILYIKPYPFNERVDLPKTLEAGKQAMKALPPGSKLFAEQVAYQRAAIKGFKTEGLSVVAMTPISDKRARYETAALYIIRGQVRFPIEGVEDLLIQMLNFGIESHDDLLDALVYLIIGYFGEKAGGVVIGKPDKI